MKLWLNPSKFTFKITNCLTGPIRNALINDYILFTKTKKGKINHHRKKRKKKTSGYTYKLEANFNLKEQILCVTLAILKIKIASPPVSHQEHYSLLQNIILQTSLTFVVWIVIELFI